MNIGSVSTKKLTKHEIIELINRAFPDDIYDDYDTVCIITEVSEYKGERRQSVIFTENLNF